MAFRSEYSLDVVVGPRRARRDPPRGLGRAFGPWICASRRLRRAPDALLAVYCVLRDLPGEAFGGEVPERERYAQMGALLVALDAANSEAEALAPEREAGLRPAGE